MGKIKETSKKREGRNKGKKIGKGLTQKSHFLSQFLALLLGFYLTAIYYSILKNAESVLSCCVVEITLWEIPAPVGVFQLKIN